LIKGRGGRREKKKREEKGDFYIEEKRGKGKREGNVSPTASNPFL